MKNRQLIQFTLAMLTASVALMSGCGKKSTASSDTKLESIAAEHPTVEALLAIRGKLDQHPDLTMGEIQWAPDTTTVEDLTGAQLTGELRWEIEGKEVFKPIGVFYSLKDGVWKRSGIQYSHKEGQVITDDTTRLNEILKSLNE